MGLVDLEVQEMFVEKHLEVFIKLLEDHTTDKELMLKSLRLLHSLTKTGKILSSSRSISFLTWLSKVVLV